MSRKQLEAALATVDASIASLKATRASLEAALESADDPTELLDLKTVKEDYDIGRDALLAAERRGELELHQPANKLLVERGKLEAWMRSTKRKPTQRRPVPDLEAWKAEADRCIEGGS